MSLYYRVSQKITLCWRTAAKQGKPCIIGDPANVMKDQAHAGKNVHWSDLWPILFRLGSLCSERPSQAVCPGRSGWKPPIKNLRCDWLRPGRPGWESRHRQREVSPLWLYFQLLSLNIRRQRHKFIGSQDHLDGRKLEQRLEQILERIKRYQSQKLTFCF